jgi:hypothetical protein
MGVHWCWATRLAALASGVVMLPACGSESAAPERPPASQPKTQTCSSPRIPEGELQNQASGPSVFGIVVGGEPGLFDAFGESQCGVAGVRICLFGTELCTQSDAAGQFVLGGLPEDQDVEISMEKLGSVSLLRPLHTASVPLNLRQTRLVTLAGANALSRTVGVDRDDTKGLLIGIPLAPGEGIGGVVMPEDVVMTLVPDGPTALYTRGAVEPSGLSSDEFDRDLLATRYGGWGTFFNVDPGDYAVRFERSGRKCSQGLPGFGYGLDADGNVRTKIVAGHQSSIAVFCQ